MNLKNRKPLANIMMFVMVLSIIFNTGTLKISAAVQSIVEWECTDASTVADVVATGGNNKDGAVLTNSNKAVPTWASGSLKVDGWDDGANIKYWQIAMSSKGFENLKLSAKTRSSKTGPSEFKVIYSTDGEKWSDIENSSYKITDSVLANYMNELELPKATSDSDKLIIRFIMTSNKAVNGLEVKTGGVSNINSIKVTGTPVEGKENVSGVNSNIESGSAIPLGQEITLNCATPGATIKYSLNGSEYKVYDGSQKLKLTTLPVSIVAYAEKSGLKDSIKTTFNYTQTQTATVIASPNGGSVKEGQKVELKSTTENAKIKYSLDEGKTWVDYKEAFVLDKLPAKVIAKATAEGMLDSVEAKFDFTKKKSETYNEYFGQLHSHTTNSDGIGSLDDAYSYASKVPGLDFLAVTDHSNWFDNDTAATINDGSGSEKWKNGQNAADRYTNGKFVGIYAYEMTWSNGLGHMNTFNTGGFQTRNDKTYKASNALQTYYNTLKTVPQSISQFNHPGKTFGDFNDFANYDPEIDKQVTLMEVGNGEGAIGSSGYFEFFDTYSRALDKGWHLAPTIGQDNHKGKWGNANTGRTVLLADSLERNNLYDAMRNRRAYATEDENLKIMYTLNDEVMGTILNSKPATANIKVDLEDPDGEAIGDVKVIANGGKVIDSKKVASSKEEVTFNIPTDYSYYFIRVNQDDKDVAVTAPVWVGDVEKAGISKTSADTALPIKGEKFKITTDMYNNESSAMAIKNIEYSIDGKIINSNNELGSIDKLSTKSYSFDYVPEKAGSYNVDVKVTALLNGVEKVYTDVLKLKVEDPAVISKVVIDGTHFNDYVDGYYAENMGNFSSIAGDDGVEVKVETNEITDELLKNTDLLVITPPAKKESGSYKPKTFSDEFIERVKRYVDRGGSLVVCGAADYQDGEGEYQSSTQINKLLEKIGAKSRLNNDEVLDDDVYSNQKFRLSFDKYNLESPFLKDVVKEQMYSFYSGCSVKLDEESVKNGDTNWLVNGHDTTYSIDSNKNLKGTSLEKGEVCALASEKLSGGGNMIIGGTVFLSNYEVKASVDNNNDLQYSNFTITNNILNSIKKNLKTSKIADVRKATKGDVFKVEGVVTVGTESGNAFFDTIYIQDETGGINIFPINQAGIKLGQKVRVTGTLDEYLGDTEIRVISVEVIDNSINKISPQEMNTKEAMDYDANGGKLAIVHGEVTDVVLENGVVSYFRIKDNSGVEAKIFIDGYIKDSLGGSNLESVVTKGSKVSAIGVISKDNDGVRMRARDRSEITKFEDAVNSCKNCKECSNCKYCDKCSKCTNKNKHNNNTEDPTKIENTDNLDAKNLENNKLSSDVTTKNVKTGDVFPLMLLMSVLMISFISIVAIGRKKIL